MGTISVSENQKERELNAREIKSDRPAVDEDSNKKKETVKGRLFLKFSNVHKDPFKCPCLTYKTTGTQFAYRY